jgi:hypothetical protein
MDRSASIASVAARKAALAPLGFCLCGWCAELPPYDELLAKARDAPPAAESRTGAAPIVKDLRWRNALAIGGGALLVGAYGSQNWWSGGFGGGFKVESEGWFGAETQYGGIDKVGHAYSTYAGARLLVPLFERLGNDPAAAKRLAAWTTFGVFTAVEVMDGFSTQYAFSREDFVANAIGAALGYAEEIWPGLDAAIDFRFHYSQSPYASGWDPFGDYSGQRYYLVAKADAWPALRDNPLTRYLELSVGYGTRGYDAPSGSGHTATRDFYVGVSVNLARVIADAFHGGESSATRSQRAAERFLELVQLPVGAWHRTSR